MGRSRGQMVMKSCFGPLPFGLAKSCFFNHNGGHCLFTFFFASRLFCLHRWPFPIPFFFLSFLLYSLFFLLPVLPHLFLLPLFLLHILPFFPLFLPISFPFNPFFSFFICLNRILAYSLHSDISPQAPFFLFFPSHFFHPITFLCQPPPMAALRDSRPSFHSIPPTNNSFPPFSFTIFSPHSAPSGAIGKAADGLAFWHFPSFFLVPMIFPFPSIPPPSAEKDRWGELVH